MSDPNFVLAIGEPQQKKPKTAKIVDVYEEDRSMPSSDSEMIAELEKPSLFPHFLQYTLISLFGTILLALPSIFLWTRTGGKIMNMTKQEFKEDSRVELVYYWSILMASNWFLFFSILAGFSFLVALCGWINKGVGRFPLGAYGHLWMSYLIRIRFGLAILISTIVAFETIERIFPIPYGYLRAYILGISAAVLLLAKDIGMTALGNHYHGAHLGKRISENKKALKALGKLWYHYIPEYYVSHRKKGPRRHESHHINSDQAKELAEELFTKLELSAGTDQLVASHLSPVLMGKEAEDFIKYMDIDDNGDVIEPDFILGVQRIYRDREQLIHGLIDSDKVIKKLDSLLNFLVFVITIMLAMSLFGMSLSSQILLQVNLVVLFNFFFSGIATNAFNSIIFVFLLHPFDVGDWVVLDGQQLRVKSIGLWNTSFEGTDKRLLYRRNTKLIDARITNFARCPPQAREFKVALHMETTTKQLADMEKKINDFLKEHSRDYLADDCYVKNIEFANSDAMLFQLQYTQRSNFMIRSNMHKRHAAFMTHLKKIYTDLNIKAAPFSLDLPRVSLTPH